MSVEYVTIDENHQDQRIDNFLITRLKGLPKSRIYRAIRKGEVRVNKGRIKAEYRLQEGDQVRIPPLRVAERLEPVPPSQALADKLEACILLETSDFLIIDKPAGMPVHGGTNVSASLIEVLRLMRPQAKFLELAHRLDRDTSGCLVIAKKRQALLQFHAQMTDRNIKKCYLALLKGRWEGGTRKVSAPLLKNVQKSGERMVVVDESGKPATTIFHPVKHFKNATLVKIDLITGRTHQIRVHAQHIGHPVAGDPRYGDNAFNREMKRLGLRRLFLHSASIAFEQVGVCAVLEPTLQRVIVVLETTKQQPAR